jgi:hypothetical protein
MKFIIAAIVLVCFIAGSYATDHPSYPATKAELDTIKTYPQQGFAVWGIGVNTLGQVMDGDTVDYGDGIYKVNLGDTTSILLDSLGHQPNIHPSNPTILAYFAQTTKAVDCRTSDVWLMDFQGQHKRKITKQPLQNITALHWSGSAKLVISYGKILCPDVCADSVCFLDTATGALARINTGLSWNNGSCTGFDGVACVGDRITFRAVAGWNSAGGQYGVVLGSIDQNHPETLLSYMVNLGMCGENLSTDGPQPTLLAINNSGHDAFKIYSARDGSYLYDIKGPKIWVPYGYNFHNFTWARNNLNWAACITRQPTVYAYIIDIVNLRMMRLGFGKQGAYHPDLYIGNITTEARKSSMRVAPSPVNQSSEYEMVNIRGQNIGQGRLPGITSRHTFSPGVYLVRSGKDNAATIRKIMAKGD